MNLGEEGFDITLSNKGLELNIFDKRSLPSLYACINIIFVFLT